MRLELLDTSEDCSHKGNLVIIADTVNDGVELGQLKELLKQHDIPYTLGPGITDTVLGKSPRLYIYLGQKPIKQTKPTRRVKRA